ncbi:MAG: hypothetical protein IKY97_03070 [Mailhella sp.]|nr:hypothetical protein [Mailhella sp.]
MQVCTEEQAVQIERSVIEILERKREAMDVSRAEWGRRAFGNDVANSQSKIQAIVGRHGGKGAPKRVSVGDLVKLSQALEQDAAHVLSVALFELGVR